MRTEVANEATSLVWTCTGGWRISRRPAGLQSAWHSLQQGPLHKARRDQWEEGWSLARLPGGLHLASQGWELMVSSHTEASSCLCFLHLVNISVLGPRISSKPFFLSLGIKKKIPHDCPTTLQIHYLHSNWLQGGKVNPCACARMTLIPT